MASETWYGQLENALFNKFSKLMKAHSNSKVNSANYTSSGVSTTEMTLPTVYIHLTNAEEIGRTFDNGIAAVRADFQIDVYTDTKQDCMLISRVATAKMSEIGFQTPQLPIIDSTADISHSIARYRISIGSDNTSTGLII